MNLNAKKTDGGFLFEFEKSSIDQNDIQILSLNKKTREITDYIWPNGANIVEAKIREKHYRTETWLSIFEIQNIYLADWCLDAIEKWEEKNEDYFNPS